jgi:hypothetical protein
VAGNAAVIGGLISIAAGIPLLIVGARRVKSGIQVMEAPPTLTVGPTGASLTWAF